MMVVRGLVVNVIRGDAKIIALSKAVMDDVLLMVKEEAADE